MMFDSLFAKYERIVFFDTETTGLHPESGDQIIELAAIALDASGNISETDEFIHLHCMRNLPEKIVELTGITDKMLETEGIGEEDALQKFLTVAGIETGGRALLVAHNAQFDLQFAAYALMRRRNAHKDWMAFFNACDYLDTLTIFRDRHKFPHKLSNAISAYGLDGKVENTHRAVDDCKALYEVAKAMAAEKDDIERYINLFGFNPKYGISGRMLKKVQYKVQGFNSCQNTTKLYEC